MRENRPEVGVMRGVNVVVRERLFHVLWGKCAYDVIYINFSPFMA